MPTQRYKGTLPDGTKSIMTFRWGTELVPLEALTDEEIPYALAREMRAPTPAPLAALKASAGKHGLQWRRKLADAWLIGADARTRRAPAALAPQHAGAELAGWLQAGDVRHGAEQTRPDHSMGRIMAHHQRGSHCTYRRLCRQRHRVDTI
jgi:hypothetical protein